MKKILSGLMLATLLIGILAFIIVQPVKASGTIHIRADGSIDPPSASIQRDENLYTFADDIYDEIVVERDNIVLDGAGHSLQGTGSGTGVNMSETNGVTIKNMQIKAFDYGVYLSSSDNSKSQNNRVEANNITARMYGVFLGTNSSYNTISGNIVEGDGGGTGINLYYYSSHNSIVGNNIVDYWEGIQVWMGGNYNIVVGNHISESYNGILLWGAIGNKFYHNNFINNQYGARASGFSNIWNDTYPSGGNYWSNYVDVDLYSGPTQDISGSDGIWDHPYIIDANNQDHYPLVKPLKMDTQVPFTFQPNPAAPGEKVTLSGTVKDTLNKLVYPAQVVVEYSTNDGTSWNPIWTLNTNTVGEFSQSFNAPGIGTYLVRVSYPGSSTYNPSSSTQTLVVQTGARVNTAVVFTFSPNPVDPGQSVTLSGTLTAVGNVPVYPAQVRVEYSIDGGVNWNFFTNLNTNAAGQFSVNFGAPWVGTYLVRARYAGSTTYNPSSSTQTLTVSSAKLKTQIVFSLFPNPALPGQTVTLSGTLKDVNGNPVFPASVTVEYSLNGGATWNPVWTLNTNAAGQFSVNFGAPWVGTYLVRARYAGSTTYNPSSSTQTLTINP